MYLSASSAPNSCSTYMAFEIRRPALLDPHVGDVGGGDRVAEPLVAALVDDDEVELQADADAGPVALEIAVGEAVAVGDGALMLHPGVRHFDQLVAVLAEGILAEVVLERLDHRLGLGELHLGLVEAARQHVEVERQIAEPVREVHVVADVERDVVAVDRVLHVPVPARVAVAEIGLADELAVRDVDQVVRDRDAASPSPRPRRATDPCSATRCSSPRPRRRC